MTRKLSTTGLILVLTFLFTVIPVQAEKSYYAERFDVHIDVQENGSAIITETVDFHFEGDPFKYAFREIAATETDGLTFLDASMDGVPMQQGTQAGQVEVKAGDPLKVTWHFPPTSNSTHSFTVRYRADGVIRKDEGGDTLVWRAIPEGHEYAIDKSTITLTYPSKATLLGQPTLDWNYDSHWENGRILLTASGIAKDQDIILTAHFAPGSLTQSPPYWQTHKEQTAAALKQTLPVAITAGLVALFLGGLGLWRMIQANRRELSLPPLTATATPPSDLSAAIVGKLTGQSYTFMGATFDLAERGVLEVEEEKSRWGMKNHVLVRKDSTVLLEPFEQGLLNALYKPGQSRINMNEVGTRMAMKSKLFDEPLEQELIQRGWLDAERKQKRSMMSVSGLLVIILSLLLFIFSLAGGGLILSGSPAWLPLLAAAAGISAALFILSIPWLVYAATFSILTPIGEEQALRWKEFGEYLKRVSKSQEPAVQPDYFEKYLAYAAVFGLGKEWAKYFQELGGVPMPVWFHAMDGMEGDFGAMVAIMAASDTAGASADGGGSGASGGGSSGAG
jgi:uncharacterized protein (TIGR04222 family)